MSWGASGTGDEPGVIGSERVRQPKRVFGGRRQSATGLVDSEVDFGYPKDRASRTLDDTPLVYGLRVTGGTKTAWRGDVGTERAERREEGPSRERSRVEGRGCVGRWLRPRDRELDTCFPVPTWLSLPSLPLPCLSAVPVLTTRPKKNVPKGEREQAASTAPSRESHR